jgi:hypothetical protein
MQMKNIKEIINQINTNLINVSYKLLHISDDIISENQEISLIVEELSAIINFKDQQIDNAIKLSVSTNVGSNNKIIPSKNTKKKRKSRTDSTLGIIKSCLKDCKPTFTVPDLITIMTQKYPKYIYKIQAIYKSMYYLSKRKVISVDVTRNESGNHLTIYRKETK